MKYYVNSFKLEEMMESFSPIFSLKLSRDCKKSLLSNQIELIEHDIYDLKSRFQRRNDPYRSSPFWFHEREYARYVKTEYALDFIFDFLIFKFPKYEDKLNDLKNEDKIQKIFQENKDNFYDMSGFKETIKNKNELEKFTEDVIFNDELFQIEFEENEYNKILRTITYSTLLVKGLEEISSDFSFLVFDEHPLLTEFINWFHSYVDLKDCEVITELLNKIELLEEDKVKLFKKIEQLEYNNI